MEQQKPVRYFARGTLLSSGPRMLFFCLFSSTTLLFAATLQAQPSESHTSSITTGLAPLLPSSDLNQEVVALGKLLFHDTRLSANNTLSCATCHDLKRGGVDHLKTSVGSNGSVGPINAPTVLNSALNFVQFWDGRANSLEEQVAGPIHNPIEMGANWPLIVSRLSEDPKYVEAFNSSFHTAISAEAITLAIATFERSLITLNAPLDKFLKGDETALSDDAKKGLSLFSNLGCISCHQGISLGGNMYQKFGIMKDYFQERGAITKADLGRFNITGLEEDKNVFKVPSLRNVELTAPYFHDGSASTLEDAISVMADVQLGRKLSSDDVVSLAAFLRALTGDQPQ